MNIKILCQECETELTDRFSADSVSIIADGQFTMELECTCCERLIDVTITTSREWK